MAVYPFYISAKADGRTTPIEGGTRRKEGTIYTKIYQRDNGEITTPIKISQYPADGENGKLQLVTEIFYLGESILKHITDY